MEKNFNPFSLPSCFVRTKDDSKSKPERPPPRQLELQPYRQQLPDAPPPRRRSPPPKRALLPYEYPPPSGRPSMFTQLPAEIILMIVEPVDLLQRARVMRTCRYLHQVLEPNLYRHLNLLDPKLYRRSGRLHLALYNRPALLSQILTYHGPIFPPNYGEILWNRRIDEDPRWSMGLTVFQKAVNIRDLYFTDYLNWTAGYQLAPYREAVDNMVLDRLVIQVRDGLVDVVQVLRKQPELTRLELLWGGGGWENLEATDVPKLRSLSATLETAALIVPGRPVDEVNLLPSQGVRRLQEELLECLSLSTRVVRKFEMKLYDPFDEDAVRDTIQALARKLPAIEDLTIYVGGKISGRM
ncbi:hypothetical protein FRC01_011135, partial [Tulasnella sp. 417]